MAGVAWMIAGVFAWYPFAVTVFAVLSSLGISTKVGTTESDCRGLVAIVTGSNTGVGKSTAAALAANGATVVRDLPCLLWLGYSMLLTASALCRSCQHSPAKTHSSCFVIPADHCVAIIGAWDGGKSSH